MQTKKKILWTVLGLLALIGAYNVFVPKTFDARGLLYGIWQRTGDSIYYTGWKVLINTDFTGLRLNLPSNNGAIRLHWSTSNLVTGALTYWLYAGTYSLLWIDRLGLRTIQWPSGIVDTTIGGIQGKRWWDGSYAVSCDAYKHPAAWWDTTHVFVWATTNGNYFVDPDKDGVPEFVCGCDMTRSNPGYIFAATYNDADGFCKEINGWYSALDYSKIDYSKIDYSKIDYSKLDYSKLDYSKLENISYSKGGGVWNQNMYKFAVHRFDWNRYWIVADNIDLDKDGKAEWCRESVNWLNQNYCILYTASAWLKRFISSPSGWGSDTRKDWYSATDYCSNYGKFGLSWHLPSLGVYTDCDNYTNDGANSYESCLLYRYWPRDNRNGRSDAKLVGLSSSRYWTSTRDRGRVRMARAMGDGDDGRYGDNWSRAVRCLSQ